MLCCSPLRCGDCVVLCYNFLNSLSFQGAMDVIIAAVQWRSYDIRLGCPPWRSKNDNYFYYYYYI